MTPEDYKKGILEILAEDIGSNIVMPGGSPISRAGHKLNILGRGSGMGVGGLEHHLGVIFDDADRAVAGKAFEELRRDGYLESTYKDLADPDNWVQITALGREFLVGGLKDEVDKKLEAISPHLLELRRGMKDAVLRSSPDSYRQAMHSARELLDQSLKLGSSAELKTRKERAKFIMRKYRGQVSESDIAITEASADLVEAEHNKTIALAHQRSSTQKEAATACVQGTERVLKILFS